MDAVNSAYRCMWNGEERFVLNEDIHKCFDRINHVKLIRKINTTKTITEQIYSWLKAGVLDPINNQDNKENEQGTPQGGVISPLLSNIALHGLKLHCQSIDKSILQSMKLSVRKYGPRLHVIRYADDFIVIHPSLAVIQEVQKRIKDYLLEEMDLELSEEKTSISSTLNQLTFNDKVVKPGVNFLGFYMKIFQSKSYPAKSSKGVHLGLRPKLTPTFESIVSHLKGLKSTIKKYRGLPQGALISKLSPIINGWTNYYKYCSAGRAFSYCDNVLYHMLYDWSLRRHPNKTRKWVLLNYFRPYKKRKFVFFCFPAKVNIKTIPFHVNRKLEIYHRTVKNFSLFDNEQIIKAQNLKLRKEAENLFNRQKGICRWCLFPFKPGDAVEIHHLLGKNHPKRDWEVYKWLLHLHCHDELHNQFKGTEFRYLKQDNAV